MKRALISTNEDVAYFDGSTGKRLAQVVEVGNEFPVHEALFWVDCEDNVTAETHYYDNEIKVIPVPPPPFVTPVETVGE